MYNVYYVCLYCMMGNFRGWLGSHEIFPLTKINAYSDTMRVHDDGRGYKHRGSAANTFQHIASNSSHCHPADSVFDANILHLMLFVQVCRYGLLTKIRRLRVHVSITSLLVQQCHAPGLVAVTKVKINFEGLFGLSTIIRPHENYPPYGMHALCWV